MGIFWSDSQIEASRTTETIRKQHKQHKKGRGAQRQSVKSVTGEKRSDNSQPYQQGMLTTFPECIKLC